VILLAAGCSEYMTFEAPNNQCDLGDDPMVRDVIYFGRIRPGGGVVSDAEWQQFLGDVVTSKFPDGLTVVDATGQWKGANGAVEQERAEVVTILHNGDLPARKAVKEISQEYKLRFKQEAVLRERVVICASFQ